MKTIKTIILSLLFQGCEPCPIPAQSVEQIADAIRVAEGNNPRWLYGVHHQGKTPLAEPEARKRCLTILRLNQKLCPPGQDFIHFLAPIYCGGDWRQWERNVKAIIKKQNKKLK